jgi:hypothetical protein
MACRPGRLRGERSLRDACTGRGELDSRGLALLGAEFAEAEDNMYSVTMMIQFSRFSITFRYWQTIAASAE